MLKHLPLCCSLVILPQVLAWARSCPMPIRLLDATLRGIGQVRHIDSTPSTSQFYTARLRSQPQLLFQVGSSSITLASGCLR
jgi:hypothetical protein